MNFGEHTATHQQASHDCTAEIGGGGEIRYSYEYTSDGDYRIKSAAALITRSNLDEGSSVTESSRIYANKLNHRNEHFSTGMILSSKFGGNGGDAANVFPQSQIVYDSAYKTYEDRIYNCILKSDDTSKAILRWEFSYRDAIDTRPHHVYYTVTFQGNSKCRSTSMTFDN